MASCRGTGHGSFVHGLAGAIGISALVMASAEASPLLKLIGAAYLVWLALNTIRDAKAEALVGVSASGPWRAFRDGVALQFVALGLVSIALNTLAAVLPALLAARARDSLARRSHVIRRVRQASGMVMCGLGAVLTLARRPA
jgi:threonine/homoserine/homoserine lactone efflux protein